MVNRYMSALVRELLLDYSLNKLNVDTQSDLSIAIQTALSSSVFNSDDAKMLNLYLSGYTASEIASIMNTLTAKVNEHLQRIFTAIEEHSGYTDNGFIHKLEMTKKYRKGGIYTLTLFLEQHSQVYEKHELE